MNTRLQLPLQVSRRGISCPLSTLLLTIGVAFAAGVCAAAWFVALVIEK